MDLGNVPDPCSSDMQVRTIHELDRLFNNYFTPAAILALYTSNISGCCCYWTKGVNALLPVKDFVPEYVHQVELYTLGGKNEGRIETAAPWICLKENGGLFGFVGHFLIHANRIEGLKRGIETCDTDRRLQVPYLEGDLALGRDDNPLL